MPVIFNFLTKAFGIYNLHNYSKPDVAEIFLINDWNFIIFADAELHLLRT